MEERRAARVRGMTQARASEGNTQVGAWPSTGETFWWREWVGASLPPSPTPNKPQAATADPPRPLPRHKGQTILNQSREQET